MPIKAFYKLNIHPTGCQKEFFEIKLKYKLCIALERRFVK